MSGLITEFDLWQPGYGGATVYIYVAGTTTLASVYTDDDLSEAADNPQTLESMLGADGTRFGKFAAPLYTAQSYYLSIDGETTGIVRAAINDLEGEDASEAEVTPIGSTHPTTLEEFAALSVNAALYGAFVEGTDGVAATNTNTLSLAIAALTDGGEIIIPAGTYKINSLEIPEGVVIRGAGREATILQSVVGDVSFELVGDRAGFKDITLDGVSLSTNSIGVKSVGNDEIVFDRVMIRRFETGMHFLGGEGHTWMDLSIENTETGAKLHGDTDAGDSSGGSAFGDLIWNGGLISVATTVGLSLSYEDAMCQNMTFVGVGLEDCTGIALQINGAQFMDFIGCWMEGNTTDADISDDDATLTPSTRFNNVVIGLTFNGGRIDGGEFEVTGTLQNVSLRNMKLTNVDFTLTTPVTNFLILQDCYEDSAVTIGGESTKLIRSTTSLDGASAGVTTTNAATAAWTITLEPGQMVFLTGRVIARARNNENRAIYYIAAGAYREGSELAYDAQSANFTLGKTITGATSGATARIVADADGGATGTLTLIDITGAFIDNEIITDDNGTPGSATVNGTLTGQNATLDSQGVTSLRTAYEVDANYACVFAASGNNINLNVTGDTGETVEWTVQVNVVST